MTDEPLIVPLSPGAALVRLAQVSGALQRHEELTGLLPADTAAQLGAARAALGRALETGTAAAIEQVVRAAQDHLRHIYESLCQNCTAASAVQQAAEPALNPFSVLGFPDPARPGVQPVDVSTVIATFAMPQRQVLTALAFQDAPGATAYWLQEIRMLRGERLEDYLYESPAPLFHHLRIPSGPHTFRIESRDSSQRILSAEFAIEVPAL